MRALAELAGAPVTVLHSARRQVRSPSGRSTGARRKTRADALEEMGITTILELLTHYPRRYLDRTTQTPIPELTDGEEATVLAVVRRVHKLPARRGARPMVDIDVSDGKGYLHLRFFNQPWRAQRLQEGIEVAVSGKVTTFRGRHQMANPAVEVIEGEWTGRVVPVYPQSEKAGLSSMEIGACVSEALRWAGALEDPVPEWVRTEHNFASRAWSIKQAHQPDSLASKEAARRRLGFDELLRLQLVLVMRKRALEKGSAGIAHSAGSALVRRFRETLSFPLTKAQERAVAEIEVDLAKAVPMHRLLQGDVGSGKTLVALWCLLTAVAGGYQGALMAPTEVLAEQHEISLSAALAGL
ncbi:MAG TPA: DEAD/DEAH box helicase, partial [Acidimicrobiales bacterium]|nr:DEAD/DEAH box helicase [Acidimicrobiales bacterium]